MHAELVGKWAQQKRFERSRNRWESITKIHIIGLKY